jgi:hypothetical protein
MLIIASVLVLLFIIWDTGILILFAYQRKKGFSAGGCRESRMEGKKENELEVRINNK